MNTTRSFGFLLAGLSTGLLAGWLLFGLHAPVQATGNSDRFEDYIMCTGPIVQNFSQHQFGFELDGIWLLDYKTGKLQASAVNRLDGKLMAWSEVDLVKEFGIAPRSNVHFMMTTGLISKGNAALYLAETTSGKMGIYSMTLTDSSLAGNSLMIRRHDMGSFRAAQAKATEPKPAPPPAPVGANGAAKQE